MLELLILTERQMFKLKSKITRICMKQNMGCVCSFQENKTEKYYKKPGELWNILSLPNFHINMKNKLGQTPLMLAVQHNTQMVSKLMTYKDLDVNVEDTSGKTALMYSIDSEITMDNIKLIQELIQHPTYNVNKIHEFYGHFCCGVTACTDLIYAIIRKRDDVADILLAIFNTDVNLEDSEGQTALTHILHRRSFYWTSVISLLKKVIKHHSYDVNRYHSDGTIDLTNVVRLSKFKPGCSEVLQILLSQHDADINLRDHTGDTVFEMALVSLDLVLIHQLLQYPELDLKTLNNVDLAGRNILHLMLLNYTSKEEDHLRYEHIDELFNTVLGYPLLNVSAKDIEGKSPLIYILNSDEGMLPDEVIKKVITHPKYHPTQTYFDGYVDIMRAAHKLPSAVSVLVLEELVQLDQINVMVLDTKGTVLRYVQRTLVENNINPKIKTRLKQLQQQIIRHKTYNVNKDFNDKCNDLLWAAGNGYWDLLEDLLQLPNADMHRTITSCNDVKDSVSFLKSKCTKGMNVLHLVCKYGDTKSQLVSKLLWKENVNVNIQDNEGYTYLMYAVNHHNPSVIQDILNHSSNCDLSIKNKSGQTVFDIVKQNEDINPLTLSLLSEKKNKKQGKLGVLKDLSGLSYSKSMDCLAVNRQSTSKQIDLTDIDFDSVDSTHNLCMRKLHQNQKETISRSVMITELHHRKLLGNQSYLCENLSPNDLLQNLLQKQILTKDDANAILMAGTRRNVVMKVLSYLLSNNATVFMHFINALRSTGQGYIADELEAFDPVELPV